MADKIFLEQLEVKCKIGIFDWERKIKQKVYVDMEIPVNIKRAAKTDNIKDAVDYKTISKHIIKFISESEYFLIEALIENLAQSILKKFKVKEITLRISKPGAIRGSKNIGIEITRRTKKV